MYPKLGMIHDFHFVWILRALSFKVTWYVWPPQMCPFSSSWSDKHAFGRARAELIMSKFFILIFQLRHLYAVPTLLLWLDHTGPYFVFPHITSIPRVFPWKLLNISSSLRMWFWNWSSHHFPSSV
jgi:hypothetical protein